MSVLLPRVAAVFAAAALVACSPGASEGNPTPTAGGAVTLVTYDSYQISPETLEQFTAETGIEVEVVKSGDGAQVVNRAILTKDAPEGDVLFGVDNNLLSRALANGLFQTHQPDAAAGLDPALLAGTDGFVTPVDTGDVCLNYDTGALEQRGLDPPQNLDDLADPAYRDLLVVQNPATSTPGLAFLLATVARYGPDGFADYWQRLRDNGVLVENSWDSAYYRRFSGGSGEGKRPLVVSYATSPAAEVVFAEEPAKDGSAPTGVMTDSCYRQIEYAGVLANAANAEGGRRLVDFMLGRTYQEDLPLNNFVYPVLPGAQIPQEFRDHAPVPDAPASLPAAEVDANREAWVQQWTDTVQP